MKRSMRWELGPVAACMLVAAACNNATTPDTSGSGGVPSIPQSGTGAAGSAGRVSAAGMSASAGQSAAGSVAAGAGGGEAVQVQAIAIINALPGASAPAAGSGAAGSGAAGAAAGTSAAGSSAAGSSAAGSGAAGSSAAGGLHGMATFSKTRSGVDLSIMVTGCTDGKSYPVHIHEGTSCDNAMTQGGHWGAASMSGSAGAGGAAAGSSAAAGSGGAAGHAGSGGSAAGSSGSAGSAPAAGSGGAAGAAPTLVLRGEDIPDIKCSAGVGSTVTSRSTPDVRLIWTIGGETLTNVVGHVIVVHEGSARIACGKIEMK